MERLLVLEALEVGFGATAIAHEEARDDLVDEERVPAIEEEVKLSPLRGSLRGRREAERERGGHRSLAGDEASNGPAVRAPRSGSGSSGTRLSIGPKSTRTSQRRHALAGRGAPFAAT